jgi:dUTP pyrophosphatase
MNIKIKRLSPGSELPTRAHRTDAGFDLYASANVVVPARDRVLVPTDIAMEIPDGYFGLVTGRSGLTIREGIVGEVGIIDSCYRGGIGIMMFSHKDVDYEILQGTRCGQIVFLPLAEIDGFEECDELDDTDRSVGGFGSSGL